MRTVLRDYDYVAGHFGWLPIGLSLSDNMPGKHIIRDAANRCELLFPVLAKRLRNMKDGEQKQ